MTHMTKFIRLFFCMKSLPETNLMSCSNSDVHYQFKNI